MPEGPSVRYPPTVVVVSSARLSVRSGLASHGRFPMRRPSHYMLLCSVLVLATFSASGHLHIGAPNLDDPAAKRGGPTVVKLEPARREAAALRVTGSLVDTMGFLLAGAEVAAGPARVRTDADG